VYGNPLTTTERKYYDTNLDDGVITAITTSWAGTELDPATVNCLSAPAQGTDIDECIGREYAIVAMKVKGYVYVPSQTNQTITDNASLVRILLVRDKQTNGVQLNAEDVIASTTGAEPGISMFQSAVTLGRFDVCKDKFISLQNPTIAYDGTNIEQSGMVRPFKMNCKFRKPIVVHRNGTATAGVAQIVDNSFHIIAAASGVNLAPTLSYQARCVFIDI